MSENPIIKDILREQGQSHETRKHLYNRLEEILNRPVLSFFTSFQYPVMIEDTDADMITDMLQCMDLSNGVALIISSPGGNGLAAERIVNILRSFSNTNDFWAIVPNKAKSAATMITFGASKILMSKTSELGPIDPQVTIREGDNVKRFCVYNIIKSYEKLFTDAVNSKGRIEPYLQQLANYDEREIEDFRASIALSTDIAVRTLSTGMMAGKSVTETEKDIHIFLTPEYTKTHGRPIYIKEAMDAGLIIEEMAVHSELWKLLIELYIRTNNFVSKQVSKCIESKNNSFVAGI